MYKQDFALNNQHAIKDSQTKFYSLLGVDVDYFEKAWSNVPISFFLSDLIT